MDLESPAVEIAARAWFANESLWEVTPPLIRNQYRLHSHTVLEALESAGWVLLPPGGDLIEEWRVMIDDLGGPWVFDSASSRASGEERLAAAKSAGYPDPRLGRCATAYWPWVEVEPVKVEG